ncbi:MAG: transcriptional regulator [Candidatus Altiarchaeales archaeon HGW-Altiarchaeales-3]|nr:MAG: transcriptional regulator [Candidatus Altiarchaeales archaeon HGW-Altiarchaeales-3]
MENYNIEYKENWKDEYLKIIASFANTDGGILFIGKDDKEKVVELKNPKKLIEDIPNKIRNYIGITPKVSYENNVILIEIAPANMPVSYEGKFYVRSGATTQEIKGNELINFILKKKNLTWDALESDARLEEIDERTMEQFKTSSSKRLNISKRDGIKKILENLEIVKDGKLTFAGVLLFGKKPQRFVIGAGARAGRFKMPNDILDTVDARGNLFEQLDMLFEAVKKHLNVKFVIEGELERKDVWDYPLDAIREAIINALIHRDYLDTADIQIKIYDDKIWIWNPGKLPEGITIEMLKTEHSSKPRNRLLALVFYYAGLIEKWGSGTKRMLDLCLAQGLPEPEFKEEMGGFSVYFYKDIYTEENLRRMGLNERQIKAVLHVKGRGKITNKEYKEINNISRQMATIELKQLTKKGIFEMLGKIGRGIVYKLTKLTNK